MELIAWPKKARITNLRACSRCQVPGCLRNPRASMHKLPLKHVNSAKRQLWIDGLKLNVGTDEIHDPFYVCGHHFQLSDFAKDRPGRKFIRLRRNAIPYADNLLLKQDPETLLHEKSLNAHELKEDVIANNFNEELASSVNEIPNDSYFIKPNGSTRNLASLHSEYECASSLNVDVDFDAIEEDFVSSLIVECEDQCLQTNLAYDESLKKFKLTDVMRTDEQLRTWTGIPSFAILRSIERCINHIASFKDQLAKFHASVDTLIVLVMCKLKTNLSYKHLSLLFSINPCTFGRYFDDFIPILRTALSPVIFFPTKEQVSANLPKCFYPDFTDCRAVMDCTEAPIERFKSIESRIKSYSHYKGTHTIKINITSTPSGLISNVSSVWGGKSSDKNIVCEENLLDHFSETDAVMVDKGYSIAEETSKLGIKLYRPPTLDKPQHTEEESTLNTNIASARVHVERIMQRIKLFKIFHSKITKTMLKHIDDIVFITCAMVNLSAPILAEKRF